MAWRPYSSLISGELDNRTPGKVTGWMRFFRRGKSPLKVTFDLAGDFHEDIRGKVIRLSNPHPSEPDYAGKGTYMKGFAPNQRGTTGDITAGLPLGPWTEELARSLLAQLEIMWESSGLSKAERERRREEVAEKYRGHIAAGELYYPYVDYPYVEWYADNGRVVLELEPSQVEILDEVAPRREKTPAELVEDRKRRTEAFGGFMSGVVQSLSRQNREAGGDGNVTGVAVG